MVHGGLAGGEGRDHAGVVGVKRRRNVVVDQAHLEHFADLVNVGNIGKAGLARIHLVCEVDDVVADLQGEDGAVYHAQYSFIFRTDDPEA